MTSPQSINERFNRVVGMAEVFESKVVKDIVTRWLHRGVVDGKQVWWLRENSLRTKEGAVLARYCASKAVNLWPELTQADIEADPIGFDTMSRDWEVCAWCVNNPGAIRCPMGQPPINRASNAYLIPKRINGQVVMHVRLCPGRDRRRDDFAEAWGQYRDIGGGILARPINETRGE